MQPLPLKLAPGSDLRLSLEELAQRDGISGFVLGVVGNLTKAFRAIDEDASGSINCVADACPHRSAPLSMGRVGDDGNLRCFYHGWAFGAKGECVDVPTASGGAMQAAQEIGSCAEALGRGTDLMVKLHALEDAGAVDALAASPYFGGALGKR